MLARSLAGQHHPGGVSGSVELLRSAQRGSRSGIRRLRRRSQRKNASAPSAPARGGDPVLNCFAPLSADRAPESADFVVARRGKNASALSSSARRRAIPLADARLGILSTPPMEGKDQEEGDHQIADHSDQRDEPTDDDEDYIERETGSEPTRQQGDLLIPGGRVHELMTYRLAPHHRQERRHRQQRDAVNGRSYLLVLPRLEELCQQLGGKRQK